MPPTPTPLAHLTHDDIKSVLESLGPEAVDTNPATCELILRMANQIADMEIMLADIVQAHLDDDWMLKPILAAADYLDSVR